MKRTEFKLIKPETRIVGKTKYYLGFYENLDSNEIYKKGSKFNDLPCHIQADCQEDGIYILSNLSKVNE